MHYSLAILAINRILKKTIQGWIMIIQILFTALSIAASPVLAPLSYLERAGVKILETDKELGVGFAHITEKQKAIISNLAHEEGRCGGFELLMDSEKSPLASLKMSVNKFNQLQQKIKIQKKDSIALALQELKEENLKSNVEWLVSFPSRHSRQANPNKHVEELAERVRELLGSYPGMWQVDAVAHQRTNQKSLRVSLTGKKFPSEIVVLGGHLDSINQSWGSELAPGADDNASGSANLIETLRVFIQQGVPERTVEFYWYAAEEIGLVGSGEIASKYKTEQKDVISVLQLDMTSFPGSGEFVIGNVTDYTTQWLRDFLVQTNQNYLNVKIVEDKCGYACSDHASWYRQGYATLLPFEATTNTMNRKIHTDKDLPDSSISFRHSLVFAKIALVYAMELGNSRFRGAN
jgi:leucyl aminopeptidase